MSEFMAEFIGTMILILLGDGVVANVCLKGTKGHSGGWIVITFGWGLAVFTAVTISGEFSGAHINPAVTVGLAAAGLFPLAKVPLFIAAQLLGAATGAFLVWLFYKDQYDITDDEATILATFATGPQVRKPLNNMISEIIGTFVLIMAVLYIAAPKVTVDGSEIKVGMGALGALPVALVVTAIGLSLGGTTGYAINPARDLGPRIVHQIVPIKSKGKSDWAYSWIPVCGPTVGALIAAVIYNLAPAT